MKTKLFTLLLAIVASVGTMFAASGTCGDNLTWDLTDGVLIISGTGDMYPYINEYPEYRSPWYSVSSIKQVSIAEGVTSIGFGAFEGCTGLTSITIPNSVISIGGNAFSGCTGLTSMMVESNNPVYDSRDNCNAIIESSTNTLVSGCKTTIIPNSVTSIGYQAFYGCSGLTSVTIPNSVTSIGDGAFGGCKGLTSIDIPNSVTSIGGSAFSGCTGLTSVTIGNSVTSIGGYAFSGCTGLTSVTIGNSVTSIGSAAFRDCTGLTSLEISNSVDTMGNKVYFGCTNLVSLKISANIPPLGDSYHVENIAGYYNTSYSSIFEYSHLDNLKSVEAPAWFFDVPEQFWLYCPNNLEHVGVNNGELTDNILSVIKRSYKTLKSIDVSGATNLELPDEAFKECYNLQSLILPAGVKKISYMVVAECVNLQSIDIPASVEEIDQRAFENCRSLQTITFGGKQPASAPGKYYARAATSNSQLRKIGNWAFYNAHELQHLEIPEGVEEIGDAAFYGCAYMEDLSLPASVRTIGDNCFALCRKLGRITVNSANPPEIQAKTFYDVKRQIPVYVPDESVDAYKEDQYWKEFDIQGISKFLQAIDHVSAANSSHKLLRNGQIFILRGDKTYTLTGQEVK